MDITINKDSAQVEIIEGSGCRLYLYTHHNADSIVEKVRNVLDLRTRWDDPDYFSRVLFCEMIKDEEKDSDEDFGIGTMLYADINILVTLDFEKQHVHVSSTLNKSVQYDLSFSDFCDQYEQLAKL
jgi:phage-related protein